jgi:hypothetical protein
MIRDGTSPFAPGPRLRSIGATNDGDVAQFSYKPLRTQEITVHAGNRHRRREIFIDYPARGHARSLRRLHAPLRPGRPMPWFNVAFFWWP